MFDPINNMTTITYFTILPYMQVIFSGELIITECASGLPANFRLQLIPSRVQPNKYNRFTAFLIVILMPIFLKRTCA